nr:MAG TPA: hypothetical protein [Caudoviricetes sp.]
MASDTQTRHNTGRPRESGRKSAGKPARQSPRSAKRRWCLGHQRREVISCA